MAYSAPNSFSNATKIEAAKVQENVDTLKAYINGNIAAGDVANTAFVEPRHIMKGLYHPSDNRYEMVSGLYIGTSTSDLPVFNPGYAGSYLASFSDLPYFFNKEIISTLSKRPIYSSASDFGIWKWSAINLTKSLLYLSDFLPLMYLLNDFCLGKKSKYN